MRCLAAALGLFLCAAASSFAQAPAAPPTRTIGDVAISGSLRTRVEDWNWFEASAPADGDYAFSGSLLRLAAREQKKHVQWLAEVAIPVLLSLPDDAIATGAAGQLGFGATYYAANDNSRNVAAAFLKQAWVKLPDLAGVHGQSLTAGRMDFVDGAEVVPANPTLAAVKRDRIAHRLIGNFVFTHVGRSIDGVQYVLEKPGWNVTAIGGRPTQGVFQVDGWGEVDVNLAYGALTHDAGDSSRAAEWRAFAIGYDDRRTDIVKTDNRPLAIRRADTSRVTIATIGGHYLESAETGAGTFDLLAWGAAQTGSWGALSHRAAAFALEGGWQPSGESRVRPWIRGGFDYGSGDGDPNDSRHTTFFQVLPTPRVYARFPFFNMMNMGDTFGELVLRPAPRYSIRADVHALRLADAADLWYSGGGAFQPGTFGYTGRPSGGQRGFATLVDTSADAVLNRYASVGAYLAHAAGHEVVDAIYPTGSTAWFGYLEATFRF